MLTIEQAEPESRMAEVRRLEEPVHAAPEDSKALHEAHGRVNELTAERASFSAGTEQAMAERKPLLLELENWKLLQGHATKS